MPRSSLPCSMAALELYAQLQAAGIDVLLDDRGERPGVMFADLELIGIPHRIVIGERGLKSQEVEYQARTDTTARNVPIGQVADLIREVLSK
jgi:prolyl-tRNA synthetase